MQQRAMTCAGISSVGAPSHEDGDETTENQWKLAATQKASLVEGWILARENHVQKIRTMKTYCKSLSRNHLAFRFDMFFVFRWCFPTFQVPRPSLLPLPKVSAAGAALVTQPMDVVKTRMQAEAAGVVPKQPVFWGSEMVGKFLASRFLPCLLRLIWDLKDAK